MMIKMFKLVGVLPMRESAVTDPRSGGKAGKSFVQAAPGAVLVALLLGAAHAQTAQNLIAADGARVKPNLSAYISRDLDPEEQALVRSTLRDLPQQTQDEISAKPANSVHIAIVEGGTGVIHYNRPEDAGSYEFRPSSAMPGDERPFADDGGLDPGVFGGSGSYRRVYTKPVEAAPQPKPTSANDLAQQHYYVTEGDASIACDVGSFAPGDIGYSYMGGWSGNWNSVSGANAEARAIDAGLQYSPANNNYAMIMAIAGAGIITHSNAKGSKTPPRIQCTDKLDFASVFFSAYGAHQLPSVAPGCWQISKEGNDANFIGFPVKDCNTYSLVLAVATDQFVGSIGSIAVYYLVWFSPNYQYGGWGTLQPYTAAAYNGSRNVAGWLPRVPCENCAFKWMTSIAQKHENLADKSWYAASWSSRRILDWPTADKYVNLPAAETYCTEYPLWHASYPENHAEDCLDTPAGLTGAKQSVAVSRYSGDGEVDLIDLKY